MEERMTQEAIDAELERARHLLKVRESRSAYQQNVEVIKARIAELEGMSPIDG